DATRASVHQSAAGPIVLPGADAGYPADEASAASSPLTVDDCGLMASPREAIVPLVELFHASGDRRPRMAAVWSSRGAGASTVLMHPGRLARIDGCVPVTVALLEQADYREVVRGRTLFVIADRAPRAWVALVAAAVAAPKPHVLVVAGREEIPGVHGIALRRLP